jgi:hypothetical protein
LFLRSENSFVFVIRLGAEDQRILVLFLLLLLGSVWRRDCCCTGSPCFAAFPLSFVAAPLSEKRSGGDIFSTDGESAAWSQRFFVRPTQAPQLGEHSVNRRSEPPVRFNREYSGLLKASAHILPKKCFVSRILHCNHEWRKPFVHLAA